MKKRTEPLGKGLGALLPYADDELSMEQGERGSYFLCPVDRITPNPLQPRKTMDDEPLRQLTESIKEKGVLQPLIVTKNDAEEGFELIAGERRWRASKLAGLEKVPVIIKEASTQDRLEIALIENIQRQDLNPLEEAESYLRLVKDFGLTQEAVAKRVGKERSTVANTLRILQLPDYAKRDLAGGLLSVGHARALLSLGDAEAARSLRDKIISTGMNVRQAEAEAKMIKKRKEGPRRKKPANSLSRDYCRAIKGDLENFLGTGCRIVQHGGRGRLEIEYSSPKELERLLSLVIHP